MDTTALALSLNLAFWTCVILFPLAIFFGRLLAWQHFPGKAFVEAVIALPLVLPPTVLGFYFIIHSPGIIWFSRLMDCYWLR